MQPFSPSSALFHRQTIYRYLASAPTGASSSSSAWRILPARTLDLRSAYGPGEQGESSFRIRQAIREIASEDEMQAEEFGMVKGEEKAVAEAKVRDAKRKGKGKEVMTEAARRAEEARPSIVQDVEIPKKPDPPGSEECCMSGCAHCVYDLYADALAEYKTQLSTAKEQLTARNVPYSLWPEDIPPAHTDFAATQDGETAREDAEEEVDLVIKGLDPVMKGFLETERKIKRRKRERDRREAKRKEAVAGFAPPSSATRCEEAARDAQ